VALESRQDPALTGAARLNRPLQFKAFILAYRSEIHVFVVSGDPEASDDEGEMPECIVSVFSPVLKYKIILIDNFFQDDVGHRQVFNGPRIL
jgi:hypothetical protein